MSIFFAIDAAERLASPDLQLRRRELRRELQLLAGGCARQHGPNVKCLKAAFTPATFIDGQTGATAPSFRLVFRTQVD